MLDRYSGRAFALAGRIVRDDALAEDVVQEALLAYWRTPSSYVPTRGAFGPWLLALVHHEAVDAVRRESPQQRLAAAVGHLALTQPATALDVADLAAVRSTAGSVRAAVTARAAAVPTPRKPAG
ncbi:sigma factor [Geodermatophilus sp. SYSU D01176]